jgi:chemotaxis protein CheZ
VQRKVFRVERMFGGRAAARPMGIAAQDQVAEPKAPPARTERPDAADGTVQSLKRELALLHDAIARNKCELAVLIGHGRERHMAHAAGKLGAAVEGMEKATEKILKSTEVIDDSAKALAATLKDDYKRGLAQEIQEHVVKIYEACNFQDLSGQRIGHVIETLNKIEDQVEAMLERHSGQPGEAPAGKPFSGHALLNGPRLNGDSGHTSQRDIDKMFG